MVRFRLSTARNAYPDAMASGSGSGCRRIPTRSHPSRKRAEIFHTQEVGEVIELFVDVVPDQSGESRSP